MRSLRILRRLVFALWIGGGVFFAAIAAPVAFRNAPNSAVAADFVGAMLGRWHYIAVIAPLALLLFEWYARRLAQGAIVILLAIAAVAGAAQAGVDLRVRSIRASSVPISELAREHPVRRQFGALHGVSSMLLLLQLITAIAALSIDKSDSR
jgi:hypothetical protein